MDDVLRRLIWTWAGLSGDIASTCCLTAAESGPNLASMSRGPTDTHLERHIVVRGLHQGFDIAIGFGVDQLLKPLLLRLVQLPVGLQAFS